MPEIVLSYQPTEKQLLFHNDVHKYRLYGGAAGGGKSHALLMESVNQCLFIPRWQALILRRTFPELESSQIQKFRTIIPSEIYKWNEQKKIATFVNESTLRFSFCETDNDVLRFQSEEFGSVAIDELTHMSSYIWTYLTSRNRSTTGMRSNMFAATNPGGPGHQWVRALWIDKQPAIGMEDHEYDPSLYGFTPARVQDNPYLMENDPEYVAQLERLPKALRDALLNGSWDILAGQYFDRFSVTGNIVTDFKIPSYWKRYIATDFGYDHPAATIWFATDGMKTIAYRELIIRKTTPEELGRAVSAASGGEKLEAWYVSFDAFARRTSERTVADEMTTAGLPPPSRADRTSPSGWTVLNGMFSDRELLISADCPELIATIPLAIRDYPARPESVLKFDGDDPIDALHYGAVTHRRTAKLPYEAVVAEKLSKALNPNHAAMLARQIEAKIKPGAMVGFRRAWRPVQS
jgi:hypothetical protein